MTGSILTRMTAQVQAQWQTRGWFARMLYPLSCLTEWVVRFKHRPAARQNAWRAPVPVLVIGNIYVGGTGKTPSVIACAKALSDLGWRPGIISRGYGVNIGPAPRLSSVNSDPTQIGDEPALIALESGCPVAVHPQRRLAIEKLLSTHPNVNLIISDDGLQHVKMARDLEIVVQDNRGCGNGWLLPAGPLREPPSRLKHVDAIITRLESQTVQEREQSMIAQDKIGHDMRGDIRPLKLDMTLVPMRFRHLETGRHISLEEMRSRSSGSRVGAAAGIGVPERFFNTIRDTGVSVLWTLALPDHHHFDSHTFGSVVADMILITAKDAIKCNKLRDDRLWVLEVTPRFSDDHVFQWLHHQLNLAVIKIDARSNDL